MRSAHATRVDRNGEVIRWIYDMPEPDMDVLIAALSSAGDAVDVTMLRDWLEDQGKPRDWLDEGPLMRYLLAIMRRDG